MSLETNLPPAAQRAVISTTLLVCGIGTALQAKLASGLLIVFHPNPIYIPLIIAAMRAIDPEGEWYSLGQIGQYITQGNPDFDTRTYGSAKLSDLIKKISRFEVQPGPSGQLLARDRA